MKYKTLIVGGTGLLGEMITKKLLAEGLQVNVLTRGVKSSVILHSKANYYTYTDIEEAFFEVEKIIFVFGSLKPFDTDVKNYFEELEIFKKLLAYCEKYQIKKAILLSSGGAIYGNILDGKAKETTPNAPVSFYGYHKIVLEELIKKSKLPSIILRVSNPYGFDYRDNIAHGLINVVLSKIITNEKIVIFGDGNNIKDYIYIDDVTDSLYKALQSNITDAVYNIGFGYSYSINEILKKIFYITNKKLDITYQPENQNDIKRISLDITHALDVLDWRPIISIDDGILLTYKKLLNQKIT